MSQKLIISDIKKRYGRNSVLQDVNVHLNMGRIIGLAGANGVGKTTLLKILSGVIFPNQGGICIGDGINSQEPLNRHQLSLQISFIPNTRLLSPWLRVKQQVAFANDIYDDFNIDKALNLCRQWNINMNSNSTNLSKGYQSLLLTILTLSREVPIYLLDEPMEGLDPAAKKSIKTIIRTQSHEANLILNATHLLKDLESILDELLILKDGCVEELTGCDDIRNTTDSSIEDYVEEVIS